MAYGDMTRTTVLEAVNVMLGVLGIRPVNDIDTSGVSEAAMARDVLHEISREIQTVGWLFNTDTNYPLTPDSQTNEIAIPANAISCDPTSWYSQYVERANKLYDRQNRTFIFSNSVDCDITWFMPFDELPEAARRYIAIVAGRTFQDRYQADKEMWKFTEQDEARARGILEADELRRKDVSFFDNTYLNRGVLRRR